MKTEGRRLGWGSLLALIGAGLLTLPACEEEKPPPAPAPAPEPEPAPAAPKMKTNPRIRVDEAGPIVRGMSAMLEQENGAPNAVGLGKLKQYLADEKEFLEGKDVLINVDRQAKPHHVAILLREIGEFSPKRIKIQTQTRDEYPGALDFVPENMVENPDACSLIGTITEDRGTAIWRLNGGKARKRGRGMGGPDLSMTGDTIVSMAKKCDSDLFFATAVEGVEWGLVYDLAASAVALEKASLSRVVIPTAKQTAGHAVELP